MERFLLKYEFPFFQGARADCEPAIHNHGREETNPMLFVIHAVDKADGMPIRAKFYRAHRVHLDQAERYNVDVVTAGTLVADDGETPAGSVFVIDAKDRATVDAFFKTAMAAGGRDNGAPGVRAHYHPDYYGAFVLDPDGHNIEAVCHAPPA